MKKLAIVLAGILLLLPAVSFAQTTTDVQYHTTLLQLISLIEQQIVQLQNQLSEQEDRKDLGTTATTTNSVVKSTSATSSSQEIYICRYGDRTC